MRFYADFHVHSRFSIATSREADLEHLSLWARRKGLAVVGTGDFTHPGWLAELEEKLVPGGEGLYILKEELRFPPEGEFLPRLDGLDDDWGASSGEGGNILVDTVRFIPTVEISNIYKRHGRVRKVHNLVFTPDLEGARKIAEKLGAVGNTRSDGRPILGLDSRDLLEIVLECSEESFLVPAHIWTPHFSMLGARSGFDDIEECFGDLAGRIFAVETGLSSDPPMNWRLKMLDRLTLISDSDAHSPSRLAREANVFATGLSYKAIRAALEDPSRGTFLGTIEFFPEEGKYHLDGHRACGVRMTPEETMAADGLCPVCGRKVTLGVAHRVAELADAGRRPGVRPEGKAGFTSLIPLPEILSEILGVGPASKRVAGEYRKILQRLGPEIHILKDLPLEAFDGAGVPPLLKEAVARMREGRVRADAGYDGKFGRISLFGAKELAEGSAAAQRTLF